MSAEEKQVAFRVLMPETTRNLLKAKAAKEGKTMNDALLEMVEDYIEDEKPSTPKNQK